MIEKGIGIEKGIEIGIEMIEIGIEMIEKKKKPMESSKYSGVVQVLHNELLGTLCVLRACCGFSG